MVQWLHDIQPIVVVVVGAGVAFALPAVQVVLLGVWSLRGAVWPCPCRLNRWQECAITRPLLAAVIKCVCVCLTNSWGHGLCEGSM